MIMKKKLFRKKMARKLVVLIIVISLLAPFQINNLIIEKITQVVVSGFEHNNNNYRNGTNREIIKNMADIAEFTPTLTKITSNKKTSIDNEDVNKKTNNSNNYRPSLDSNDNLLTTRTTMTSLPESITIGETFTVNSSTKYYYFSSWYNVLHGSVYWYDLLPLVIDNDPYDHQLSNPLLAVKFETATQSLFSAFSFNVTEVSAIEGNYFIVYLTSDLTNYATNYMAKINMSRKYYNTQTERGAVFALWDSPLTEQIDNKLLPETPYYIVITSTASINFQVSLDNAGTDNNQVLIYNNSRWEEKEGIDLQCAVYTGSKIDTIETNKGQTSLTYNSINSVSKRHYLLAFYYDSEDNYCYSSKVDSFDVIDPNTVRVINLESPTSAQYSDNVTVRATMYNLYNNPVVDETLLFYYSEDNTSWTFIETKVTDLYGRANIEFNISKADGVFYFKATNGEYAGYSNTTCEKEIIVVDTPLVQAQYGTGYKNYNSTSFKLKVRVHDDDGTPIKNEIVYFYVYGFTWQWIVTNEEGYAESFSYSVNWDADYYANRYWIKLNYDESHYIYPNDTYGDILITKGCPSLELSQNDENLWDNIINLKLLFHDGYFNAIPNLTFEKILFSENSNSNSSIGEQTTNSSGQAIVSFPAKFFNPGQYKLYIKVSTSNYEMNKLIIIRVDKDELNPKVTINNNTPLTRGEKLNLTIDSNATVIFNLTIYLNGQILDQLQTDTEGKLTYAIYLAHGGETNITIVWEDSYYYQAFTYSFILNVCKNESKIIFNEDSFYYNSSIPLIIQLVDENLDQINETMTMTMNGELYQAEGIFFWDISSYDSGSYNVKVIFGGNQDYLNFTLSIVVTILPQPTKIVVIHKTNSTIFSINLQDSENRSISMATLYVDLLDANGSIIEALEYNTGKNGFVIVDYTEYPTNATLMKIVYLGDIFGNFNSTSTTVTIPSHENSSNNNNDDNNNDDNNNTNTSSSNNSNDQNNNNNTVSNDINLAFKQLLMTIPVAGVGAAIVKYKWVFAQFKKIKLK